MIEGINSIYKRMDEIKKNIKQRIEDKPVFVKKFEDLYKEKLKEVEEKKAKKSYHPYIEELNNGEKDVLKVNDSEIRNKIEDAIETASNKYAVSKDLIKSIIKVESNFDPFAVSKAGAMGLMQIMPKTSLELGLERPFDIYENIDAGVKYLKMLLDKYNGDLDKTLAAYNAGPDKVDKNNSIPEINETKEYINRIKKLLFNSTEF